ncbi:TetR/AcrR family transcriptional regulator [Corallococcus praedator]|uniref:TetR/AcrR family transcriptional regulator n=1 Tax=Corallococcus praedator TaxID=2316724 RepID=A0ABX9QBW4_9BACT|nr:MULTISPECIES: TetR/AcrR family transcriptional regulator [Corallococcus]RKH22686.1 TetR/AcrR family transcriptional regulator [Corallococcus sp. CA031C]RKH99160.1 TetR/AcrR family transcriptional regulator [Corallococcus praedator]
MAVDPKTPAKGADDARRRKLLEASLGVFSRFGYRKASMEEVARAADVSRQGLYLHFATKEELFRAAVEYALGTHLEAALAALAEVGRPLEARLVAALDEWLGRYVGHLGAEASDLSETSGSLTGTLKAEHEARFEKAVARALTDSPLMAVYASAGLTAPQLARTLHATARGWKHTCTSRESFIEHITVAVRMLFAPLRRVR